ncbi:MAG: hypothetical protein SGPRY_003423, partial [Prymnesium sp.]
RSDLQLDLAIVLDATIFCQKTYRLEGDRLEDLLVVDEIEAIREKSKALGSSVSSLPNVITLLRSRIKPTIDRHGCLRLVWPAI